MDNNTGASPETNRHYYSYMMRLLRTQNGHTDVWRVSLEEPLSAEMHRFDDLDALFNFLLARTGHGRQVGASPLSSTGTEITDQRGASGER